MGNASTGAHARTFLSVKWTGLNERLSYALRRCGKFARMKSIAADEFSRITGSYYVARDDLRAFLAASRVNASDNRGLYRCVGHCN